MQNRDRFVCYIICMLMGIGISPLAMSSIVGPAEHVAKLLSEATYDFKVPKKGVIHIGARNAEELPIYKAHKIKNVLWIEADPSTKESLQAAIKGHMFVRAAFFAATDTNGMIELHRTNNGHSSSILTLKNHHYMSPDVKEADVYRVPQKRLDDYLQSDRFLRKTEYNIIVIDIQGAELIALKGAVKTLEKVDAIISEVNYDDLYEGAANVYELDNFLAGHDFLRVDTLSVNRAYGDALYVKKSFCTFKD